MSMAISSKIALSLPLVFDPADLAAGNVQVGPSLAPFEALYLAEVGHKPFPIDMTVARDVLYFRLCGVSADLPLA